MIWQEGQKSLPNIYNIYTPRIPRLGPSLKKVTLLRKSFFPPQA